MTIVSDRNGLERLKPAIMNLLRQNPLVNFEDFEDADKTGLRYNIFVSVDGQCFIEVSSAIIKRMRDGSLTVQQKAADSRSKFFYRSVTSTYDDYV